VKRWALSVLFGLGLLAAAYFMRHRPYWPDFLINAGTAVLLFTPLYFFQKRILEQQRLSKGVIHGLAGELKEARKESERTDDRLTELAARISPLMEPDRRPSVSWDAGDVGERTLALLENEMRPP
jgi:hypothetical protein